MGLEGVAAVCAGQKQHVVKEVWEADGEVPILAWVSAVELHIQNAGGIR